MLKGNSNRDKYLASKGEATIQFELAEKQVEFQKDLDKTRGVVRHMDYSNLQTQSYNAREHAYLRNMGLKHR